MSPDYREVIAGTDIEKNPELPAPKKIVGHSSKDIESGQIEAPLSNDRALPSPSPKKIVLPKVKKDIFIRETDNGYLMTVHADAFSEEWCFTKLKQVVKTVAAFFQAPIQNEA